MDELYLIFDKIPLKGGGGLVANYIDFVKELSAEYQIKYVSVFRSEPTDIEEFKEIPVITLFDLPLDNRFHWFFRYLNNRDYRACAFAILSALRFFSHVPSGRTKTKKLLANKKVIAVAPAAAMFLSKACRYILEVHTRFEYFWGDNPVGRAQSALINQPALTLFRSKADAIAGEKLFPSSYLYNTFDPDQLPEPAPADSLRHSALFVGRLSEQKNPLMLLDCAQDVLDVLPDFQLDLYGEGAMRSTLEQEIAERGLGNCVHLRGFTRDKAVYQNYDVLWLTSKLEGFGLVIIEAAANMVPTVSVNWGKAVHEVIEDGRSGYVADGQREFVERSIEIMTSLGLRNQLARSALNLYNERFSKKRHKQAWLEVLDKVYGNGPEAA